MVIDIKSLSKLITLVESSKPEHRKLAEKSLAEIIEPENTIRIGISGPPGVGKSSLIEELGLILINKGHKVAVLAIDPSSPVSGGSIMGDKTRMAELAANPNAFVRPTPTSCNLGGVAKYTPEVIALCESHGFDIIIVETVGVGQSEIDVAAMVDFFIVMIQPSSGDELQGIKKGIIELADMVVINKADGDILPLASKTKAEYSSALRIIRGTSEDGTDIVLTSALEKSGLQELLSSMNTKINIRRTNGSFARKRTLQKVKLFQTRLKDSVYEKFIAQEGIKEQIAALEEKILQGEISPFTSFTG